MSRDNPSATDIGARQEAIERGTIEEGADQEDSIDVKRMIHRIHAADTVLYGFGGSMHDYTPVGYPAPLGDCTVCHEGPTYDPVDTSMVLATTIWPAPAETPWGGRSSGRWRWPRRAMT